MPCLRREGALCSQGQAQLPAEGLRVERRISPATGEERAIEITVIGGGLAGSEAAWQIASRGGKVALYEMRPRSFTPAHKTKLLSELVCSNSLKSQDLSNAHGLLKEELRRLNSIIVKAADSSAIPGGKALVVDRERFASAVTETICNHPNIRVVREELTDVPSEGTVIIATGPLTSHAMAERVKVLTGADNMHFFDAVSPILDGSSIDMAHAFFGARYDTESSDYLNCPLTEEEYDRFYEALINAERVDLKEFEKTPYFEGCLPIEVMAERGRRTLVFGPMKPVGFYNHKGSRRPLRQQSLPLNDSPHSSADQDRSAPRPFGIIQLRREDAAGSMFNMVGFQTKLTYPEQEKVFRLIPALKNAVFLRHGSIHRNTFINAPSALSNGLQLKEDPRVFFAGQITGVEGYMESTAIGLLAGIAALAYAGSGEFAPPPPTTCIGALHRYLCAERKDYQPMNINFGLVDQYDKRKKEQVVERALATIEEWKNTPAYFAA
jgi:methylenetetrahydrofolate--tRNA-(uracil-5-)-methyltransferase